MRSIALAAAISALASPALSHDAPSGWSYPPRCCGGRDCQALPRNAVKWTPAGWLILETGETIPESEAEQSPDNEFHRCRTAVSDRGSKTRSGCFWAPGAGI
jgi:hypothetical protein